MSSLTYYCPPHPHPHRIHLHSGLACYICSTLPTYFFLCPYSLAHLLLQRLLCQLHQKNDCAYCRFSTQLVFCTCLWWSLEKGPFSEVFCSLFPWCIFQIFSNQTCTGKLLCDALPLRDPVHPPIALLLAPWHLLFLIVPLHHYRIDQMSAPTHHIPSWWTVVLVFFLL